MFDVVQVLPVHLFSLLNCLEANEFKDVLLLEEVMADNQCATKKEERQRSMTTENLFNSFGANYSLASEVRSRASGSNTHL